MTGERDLYGLPLDRFTPERAALAKSLRSEGRRDEAAEVARLRKPSVAAWAVNQLIRTQRRAVADLFAAGDDLEHAQSELLAGRGDGRALREAGDRERAGVDGLTETARGLLSSQGHELSTSMLERVRDTLHAAALDHDARAQVADGCLERELRHVGIGSNVAAARATAAAARSAEKRRREAASQAAAQATRAAERAHQALRTAQERRDRAAEALERAEAALTDAGLAAKDADDARKRAQKKDPGRS